MSFDQLSDALRWTTREGVIMTIRKVKPSDVPLLLWASETFSTGTRYFRFGKNAPLNFTAQDIEPLCNSDPECGSHCIVTYEESGVERFAANARYVIEKDRQSCELTIVVMDQWQHQGVGKRLVQAICEQATQQGIPLIYALVLPTNLSMQKFMKKCGFQKAPNPGDDLVLRYERKLI